MFVIGNLFIAVARIVDMILFFFYWIILLRAIVSWVNPDPFNSFVQFLNRMSEPILKPIRQKMPMGRIDFSPIIAFILIIFLQAFLVASLQDIGIRLKQGQPSNQGSMTIQHSPSGDAIIVNEPMIR